MSWSKALPPVTIKERGFALSDLLQPAGLEQQHIIAGRAWVAARDLYRAHARLARLEGDHLELLLRKRWYGRCGFASFRDFVREELQRAPRTAKRRVALSRLARESPELAAALDEGRLSPCQALALSRLRDAPDLVSWIRIAEDCTVRELEDLVADYVSALSCEAGESTEPEADDTGRRFTFAAPVSASVAWDHAMDMARRVLGWEAPVYRCIEAVLEETAVDLPVTDHQKEVVRQVADMPVVDTRSLPATSSIVRSDDLSPVTEYPPSPLPLRDPTREQLETLLAAIQDAEREIGSMASIASPCEDDPNRSIDALADLKRKDRNLRLLMARLLRYMDAANLLVLFGHRSVTEFLTTRLKMSARTAARFMSVAWTFEDNPQLARAFASGRIGLGQAYLVNRVAVWSNQALFIDRAEAVTHLQFEREVRFLERLREYVPKVARQFHGPLPLPYLPKALVEYLGELGWSDARIDECVEPFDVSADPAVDPTVMAHLEGLLELVAVAREEHDRTVITVSPTLAPEPGALPTLAPEDHQGPGSPPEGLPEPLPMLAPHGTPAFLAAKTTISFWAPESLITQWKAALERVRALEGPMPTWAAAILLVRHAVVEWERVDPRRRPAEWKIFERDQWRCQAPGCSSRSRLEAHHIIFRSHGGSDDPENLITLCHGHHRRGIHDGYLRVDGAAPGGLRWRLGGGRLPSGTLSPTRTYHGSRLSMDALGAS